MKWPFKRVDPLPPELFHVHNCRAYFACDGIIVEIGGTRFVHGNEAPGDPIVIIETDDPTGAFINAPVHTCFCPNQPMRKHA